MEGDRIRMFNLSSAMGPQFAQYAVEMTEQIRSLGPSALRDPSLKGAVGEPSSAEEMTE